MPRLHALELVLDAAGDLACRRDWQALHDAGLPSQLAHPGATNSPHVTLLAVPAIDAPLQSRAADLLRPQLPAVVRPSGLVLFGGEQVTVARVLDVPAGLTQAVLDLRDGVAGERHLGWVPHLTLARRVPRRDVQRAVDVLGYDDRELTLTGLRHWDPELGTVRAI